MMPYLTRGRKLMYARGGTDSKDDSRLKEGKFNLSSALGNVIKEKKCHNHNKLLC